MWLHAISAAAAVLFMIPGSSGGLLGGVLAVLAFGVAFFVPIRVLALPIVGALLFAAGLGLLAFARRFRSTQP